MTNKQMLFVKEYLIDLNASQAIIRAGYKTKYPDKMGSQLLGNARVMALIQKAMDERNKRIEMDADEVLTSLVEIKEMNIKDILTDGGDLKPISEWPDIWCTTISGIDITTIGSGNMEAILKKIKWPDKVKILELIGKHVKVQAFKERLDHSSDDGSMTPTVIKRVVIKSK